MKILQLLSWCISIHAMEKQEPNSWRKTNEKIGSVFRAYNSRKMNVIAKQRVDLHEKRGMYYQQQCIKDPSKRPEGE